MTRPRHQKRITGVFLLVWLLWGIFLAAVRVQHPGMEIGFAGNDAHILVASEWYATNGHWPTLLIPPRQTAPRPDGSWQLYNTYPAGVFWLHEIRRGLGLTELWQHRIAMTVWNHLAVLVLFFLTRRIAASALIAAMVAGLYMFSAPYATTAGGLWEHAPMLSLLGTVAAWLEYLRAHRPAAQRKWLAATALLCAVDSLLTIQNAPMIGIIIGVTSLLMIVKAIMRGDPWLRTCLSAGLVLAMPVVVIAVRISAQAYLAGGFRPALRYFTDRAQMRMGLTEEDGAASAAWRVVGTRLGLPLTELTHPRAAQGTYPAFHPAALAGAALVIAGAWAVRRSPRLRPHRRTLMFGVLLLAASFSWSVLFREHAIKHQFVTQMSMPRGGDDPRRAGGRADCGDSSETKVRIDHAPVAAHHSTGRIAGNRGSRCAVSAKLRTCQRGYPSQQQD